MLKKKIIWHTEDDLIDVDGIRAVEITDAINTDLDKSDSYYEVRQGQTLRDVAYHVYNDARLYRIIAEYNNIIDPYERLTVGAKLRYPSLRKVINEIL